jgi:hypothetical protein
MGAPLLTQQAPTRKPDTGLGPAWWPQLYNHIEMRRNGLRSWRWSWLLHWQALASMFLPKRWGFLNVVANRMWRGNPANDQIVDSTPLQAVRVCAAGIWTGLMSPTRTWFQMALALGQAQLDEAAKDWLEDTSMRMDVVLHQSNFYTEAAQLCQDTVVFGTSPMIIYEDAETVIRCYLPCPGEYYLGNGARFTVDTLYRDFTLTILQVVEMFTLEKCPESIRMAYLNGGTSWDGEVVICHAIEPNTELGGNGWKKGVRVLPALFTYREVYWVRGQQDKQPLSICGFREKPFAVARWAKRSNEPYGANSPCMEALGDSKQVQLESLRKAEFIEKGVRPPMGADPTLKNEPASIVPATITYVDTSNGKKGFWPLFEPDAQWLAGLVADIDKVVARIQACLYVDVFLAITRMAGVQPRNELELTKRDLERLQQLGPFIELFQTEFAGPALTRVFEIMRRRGMLRPMPPSLRNLPLKIEYQSVNKIAQESAEAVALKDFLTSMGAASAAAKAATLPDPLRIVDLTEWTRAMAYATHMKSKILHTQQQVEEQDAARQQAIEQEKQTAMAPVATKEMVDAARNLSETKLNNGSALDAIVGSNAYPGQ